MSGRSVPAVSEIVRDGNRLLVTVDSDRRLRKAEFNFTRATGYWGDRCWNPQPAELENGRIAVEIPRCSTAAYFSVFDHDGCCYSSPMLEIE